LQTGFAVPPFFSVILFALFFANASQHIAILVPAVAKSCPNAKNKAKRRYVPTATTTSLMPEKKRGKLFNIKSLPLWFKKRSF
jgi:hypothetical protein